MKQFTSSIVLGACATLLASWGMVGCGDGESTASTVSTQSSTGGGGSATGGNGGGGTGGATGGGGTGGQGGTGGNPLPQNQFLYVANNNDASVSVYAIGDAGDLTFVEDEPVANGPGPLASTSDSGRLYAASVGGRAISAFDIDPATGALTAAGGAIDVGLRPVYITVDQTNSYLLLASYGENKAQSYAIEASGAINGTPISDHDGDGINAHSIILSPGNDFAFVANTNPTPETISQFAFDATTGVLSDNSPATIDVSGAAPVGPRHTTFHPTLNVFYAVNEHSDSVTVYAFDPLTGTLTEGATTSTLPGGMPAGNSTCADIHITPDGNALYASNRTGANSSLAMFSVDASGALTSLGHIISADLERPREFEITRDGRFLYAAGQDTDKLSAFRIEADGMLTALATPTYDVGANPSWVLAVTVDAPN